MEQKLHCCGLVLQYGVRVFHSVWSLIGARDCRVLEGCVVWCMQLALPIRGGRTPTGLAILYEGLERPQLLAREGGVALETDPRRYQKMAVCVYTKAYYLTGRISQVHSNIRNCS